MRNQGAKQSAVLGLFIAGGIGILAAGVFAVGDLQEALRPQIAVTTDFERVDGLSNGDSVWFSGVRVGRVTDVDLRSDGRVEATLGLEDDAVDAIPAETTARIGSDGLIGNTIVVLEADEDASQARISEGMHLPSEAGVTTDELMASLKRNSDDLEAVMADIQVVSKALSTGEGTLGKLVSDPSLYAKLDTSADQLVDTTSSAQNLTSELESAFTREGTIAHGLTRDTETWESMQGTVARFDEVSEDVASISTSVDAAITDPETPIGLMISGEDARDDVVATVDNLREGSVLLNENLEAMQHNFLLRPFFKKQEKKRRGDRSAHLDRIPEEEGGSTADPDALVDGTEELE